MNTNIKTVTSSGTKYHQDFPVIPHLHLLAKPANLLAVATSSVLVYMILNNTADANSKIVTFAIYSCLYLFVTGSLVGITVSRPPHKIFTNTITIVLGGLTLFYFAALFMLWSRSPESGLQAYDSTSFSDPVYILMITIFVVMKIPLLIQRYVRGFKQMQSEIQDSFHS